MYTYNHTHLIRSGKADLFPRLEANGTKPRVQLARDVYISFYDAADMVRFANEILELHREVSGLPNWDAA